MTRILLTAFEPYDRWPENASWSALVDLTDWYDGTADLTTRRYPVELSGMSNQLRKDIQEDFDLALHLGQSPGSTVIKLESVGLNVRSDGTPLIPQAPEAYRSPLRLDPCCQRLVDAGIPCHVSHHAGTYLCNAALYLSQHYTESLGKHTRSMFVHLPLTPAQAACEGSGLPSMSTPMASAALALILETLRADSS